LGLFRVLPSEKTLSLPRSHCLFSLTLRSIGSLFGTPVLNIGVVCGDSKVKTFLQFFQQVFCNQGHLLRDPDHPGERRDLKGPDHLRIGKGPERPPRETNPGSRHCN
ncbi:hypothetical protein PIB30_080572, partial [Stylosanthes scabra]|nr:hypothetical protein [Stylosanthes scabra]